MADPDEVQARLDELWEEFRLVEAEVNKLRAQVAAQGNAIYHASYALNPNQGERPDPVRAYMWLRTTYPPSHPNYVDPDTLT